MQASLRLLSKRRFLPLFVTQLLGAFNDNLFRTALVFIVAYDVAAADPKQAALLASTAAGLFIAPFFLFSGIAGSVADARDKAGITRLVKLSEIAFMALGWAALAIGSLPLALYWRAERPLDQDYLVYVHLLGPSDVKVAQRDTPPLDGSLPTSRCSMSRWPSCLLGSR